MDVFVNTLYHFV